MEILHVMAHDAIQHAGVVSVCLPPPNAGTREIALWVDSCRGAWGGCEAAIVYATDAEDTAQNALSLFWLLNIVPTVVVGREDRLRLPFADPRPSHFSIVPDAILAERALEELPRAVSPQLQADWTQRVFAQLEATLSHSNLGFLSLLRMARGARQAGLIDVGQYRAIVDAVNEPLLSCFVPGGIVETDVAPHRAPVLPIKSTVLLVEDQPQWDLVLGPILRSEGIGLRAARSVDDARTLLRRRTERISAILLDLHFAGAPPKSPTAIVREMSEVLPQTPIIIFSQKQDGQTVRDLAPRAFFYFFKEYDPIGAGAVQAQVTRLITTVNDATRARARYAAEQMTEWLCDTAQLDAVTADLLRVQARYLENPTAAISLNCGLWTSARGHIEGLSTFGVVASKHLRDYGAHAEEQVAPTFSEALSSWVLWIEHIAHDRRVDAFALTNRLRNVIAAISYTVPQHEYLQEISDTARDEAIDVVKCLKLVQGLKQALHDSKGLRTWRDRKIDSLDRTRRRACDELLAYALDAKATNLSASELLVQFLLLRRLKEVVA